MNLCRLFAILMLLIAGRLDAQPPVTQMSGQVDFDNIAGITRFHLNSGYFDIHITAGQSSASLRWQSSSGQAPVFRRNDEALFLLLDDTARDYDIELQIPADWQLYVSITERGNILIEGLTGSVSAWSARGDVRLREHGNSFSITAMDGDAEVDLAISKLLQPSAITGWNGILRLVTPPDLAAKIRVADGTLPESQFTVFHQYQMTSILQGRMYILNGGGSEITLRSVYGDIQLQDRTRSD